METSHLRGHAIEVADGEWVYVDTKEPTVLTHTSRPCGHCGEFDTTEGHDACLGTLPGVINACCGHGREREAYVQFPDGACVRGAAALAIMAKLKRKGALICESPENPQSVV